MKSKTELGWEKKRINFILNLDYWGEILLLLFSDEYTDIMGDHNSKSSPSYLFKVCSCVEEYQSKTKKKLFYLDLQITLVSQKCSLYIFGNDSVKKNPWARMQSRWKINMRGIRKTTPKKPKKQGYVRDRGPKKRSLLSRLSIRNHLSPATSFAQWLMGLHRAWAPAHYLLHTGPLFKHKGRNMKHCFRCCLWVQKYSIYSRAAEESLMTIFGHMNTHDDVGHNIS